MQWTFHIFVLFGGVILLKSPGTTASSHHHHRSYYNSKAAKAAWEAIDNPDNIELIHARDYDPSKELVSTDPNDVVFRLYSDPNAPEKYEIIEIGNHFSLLSSNYDPAHPLKLLIHGFQSNASSSFPQNVKNAYLALKEKSPCNVIAVDWGELSTINSKISGAFYYENVVENIFTVGTRIGKFISWLKWNNFLDLKQVHVVGFSLGAHVAGIVGDVVKKAFDLPLARITALDPAGPEFDSDDSLGRRLTVEDADFVDVLHTNAGMLGLLEDVGHVDFYVNGGTTQPGCYSSGSFFASFTGVCSHERAPLYWTKSILDGPTVKSCTCSSYLEYTMSSSCCESEIPLGEYCAPGITGSQYVTYVI